MSVWDAQTERREARMAARFVRAMEDVQARASVAALEQAIQSKSKLQIDAWLDSLMLDDALSPVAEIIVDGHAHGWRQASRELGEILDGKGRS